MAWERSTSPEEAGLVFPPGPEFDGRRAEHWTARSLRLLDDAYRDAVDTVTSAVFGVASGGKVLFTNNAGEALLPGRRWLQVSDGMLGALEAAMEAAALNRALSRLSARISFKIIVTEVAAGAQGIVSGALLCRTESSPYPTNVAALVWLTPVSLNVDVAADLASLSA